MSTNSPIPRAGPNVDTVLAAIFDPALAPADLPAKTGLSLPELARWLKANSQMVAEVREFLTQRAVLIASRLHVSSLGALDRVVRECPDLERVRKAASTILRSLKPIPLPPTQSSRERIESSGEINPAQCNGRTQPENTPRGDIELASLRTAIQTAANKLPLAERFAAHRLAAIKRPPTAPTAPVAEPLHLSRTLLGRGPQCSS